MTNRRRRGHLVAMVVLVTAAFGLAGSGSAAPQAGSWSQLEDHVTATIPVARDDGPFERSTWSVATTPRAVWVVSHRAGYVARIDPKTDEVVARIDLPVPGCKPGACHGLGQIVASPEAVWVQNEEMSELVHIDPRTNRIVGTIAAPRMSINLFAVGRDLWTMLDEPTGQIVRVSGRTHEVDRTITVDDPAVAPIAFIKGKLWISRGDLTTGEGSTRRVDPVTGATELDVPGTGGSMAVVADGDLWIFEVLSPAITRLDPATGRVVTQLALGPGISDFATAGGGSVWVRRDEPQRIQRIDVRTNQLAEEIVVPTTEFEAGVAWGHGSLWAADWSAGVVYRARYADDT